jgi:phosphatidylglycerol:prolipoprotein diacylglycerol transferase
MSFHGWLLWVILAVYIFSKIYKKSFFTITDTLAIIVPIAIGLWRIGNYINQELPWFAPYNGPFAIVKNGLSYFPSPLLELLLEGGLLFIIMLFASKRLDFFDWKKTSKLYRKGTLSSIFLIWYSVMRIIAEQFRLPDGHIGYLLGTDWLTLGIVYTLPLFITGISILLIQKRN